MATCAGAIACGGKIGAGAGAGAREGRMLTTWAGAGADGKGMEKFAVCAT